MTHTVRFYPFFFVVSLSRISWGGGAPAASLCLSFQEILTPHLVVGANTSAASPSALGRDQIKGPFACCLWEAGGQGQWFLW